MEFHREKLNRSTIQNVIDEAIQYVILLPLITGKMQDEVSTVYVHSEKTYSKCKVEK